MTDQRSASYAGEQGSLFAREEPATETPAPIGTFEGRFAERLARCTTDWQRNGMKAWRASHPDGIGYIDAGVLGHIYSTPSPMTCAKCRAPGLCIPDMSIVPERGYFLCPECSFKPKRHLQAVA